MKKYILLSTLFISCIVITQAQRYGGYQIGDWVKNFKAINTTTDTTFQLNDLKEKNVVTLVFTSNQCAFSKIYDVRLKNLYLAYENNSSTFVFINSKFNESSKNENRSSMKKRMNSISELKHLPYLCDSNATLALDFGIVRVPTVCVLKQINSKWIVVYKGAIDDNPQNPESVSFKFLEEALKAACNNKSLKIAETKPEGCLIN
jgi:peroxiredoxin